MKLKLSPFAFFSTLVMLVSFFTYFQNYWYPPGLFWDENYHIASAFKYLNNVMFMEPHPPLGKLFIALGEYLLNPNKDIAMGYALGTDYLSTIPNGFSFIGVRFFPALFGMLSALLFFWILLQITKHHWLAFAFTCLYLFENALILQSRSAMLESTEIFFILSALLFFLHLLGRGMLRWRDYCFLGMLVGASIAVKLNGSVLILLLPFLLSHENGLVVKTVLQKQTWIKTILFFFGILFVFCGSYYVHGAISTQVPTNNYYLASDAYKQILQTGRTNDPRNFPVMLADNLFFIPHYQNGVPKYDSTKVDENGSLPYTWAFGNKSINYRWETNHGLTRYLYFQGNPIIWLFGLVGLFLGIGLVSAVLFFKQRVRDKKLFFLIVVFLSLYMGYMIPILFIQRVLYLYTYLIPLLFSLLLGFSVFCYRYSKALSRTKTKIIVGMLVFLIITAYFFFSPLTYYEPLTKNELLQRSWFSFWGLQSVL